GATTGTGGRIRDVHAVGRGGHCIAGTAGYCVGNLLMPDYDLPWEDPTFHYPSNFAPPLEILIEASNGASDYGNKFGEPVISGFARSFGLLEPSGDRREWIKPIMFSGGVGSLDADMVDKLKPQKGMQVVKLGGPVYRIGVGGGSASSVEVQGDNKSELDFGAVQRGDAEMEQKLNRVIRACLEQGKNNPICSIHDQGAGGNGNVLKEIVEPEGAVIFKNKFQLGDPTITTLELWGAEYQENDAILCRPEDVPLLQQIGHRERCPINFVGTVLNNGKVILSEEEENNIDKYLNGSYEKENVRHPVDLELELVLGKMPQKVFHLDCKPAIVKSVSLPAELTVKQALERVLRLPSVASKRYLTNKVDRCVTGLVAQQQCVGPLHTPLADVAVTALSHFSPEGIATSIGEQPIKGLINPAAGARMAVAEALTNLVFARISDIKDVKCSGNWMWAAKLPGEGAALYDACTAMCKVMRQLGIAIDGGKDSLSMAARVDGDTVKAPGALVISSYAPCPNIKQLVTPDLKGPARGQIGVLLLVDLSGGKNRLGGTAIAQCFNQLGDCVPDLDEPELLKQAFIATQKLIRASKVMAGHDVSDGGLITCLLEMAIGGISGIKIDITHKCGKAVDILFAEELGWVLEVDSKDLEFINTTFKSHSVPVHVIGQSRTLGIQSLVTVSVNGTLVLNSDLLSLYRTWEETSYRLERRQANPDCVRREFESLGSRKTPAYRLTFDPHKSPSPSKQLSSPPRVAVIREEGSNGDREMAASLFSVGFEVWDVTMQDLLNKQVTADDFRGIIFPGGFSYADVLGSAKGWAASLLFHPSLRKQFRAFVEREDTFSLGVCNGCQLMGLLGWVGTKSNGGSDTEQPPVPDIVLDHNLSERFECRFSTVRIERTPSIMLRGMEGCVLGVWIAHGEGRFTFRNDEVLSNLEKNRCLAIKYVDDDGKPTQAYPLNPNGSPLGIAGVCSQDGRHLAMMPHPERCTQLWQWPWVPADWRNKYTVSPWLRIFENAFMCSKMESQKLSKVLHASRGHFSEVIALEDRVVDPNPLPMSAALKRTNLIWQAKTDRYAPIISKLTAFKRPNFLEPIERWTIFDDKLNIAVHADAFKPKVQLAHRVPPGKLRRGVEIERKRREYETHKIKDILDELAVIPAEMIPPDVLKVILEENEQFGIFGCGGYLPLELFDNEDFDCRLPGEWLDLGLLDGVRHPVPAYAFIKKNPSSLTEIAQLKVPVPLNELYDWVEVVVTKYNSVYKLYTCIRVDGIEETHQIPRIYIMFQAEDPINFAHRLADTINRRDSVENRIKFELYVDNMLLVGVPNISKEIMDNIYKCATRKGKLEMSEDFIERTNKEVSYMYRRTMNNHSFRHVLQSNPGLFNFVKVPPMELQQVPEKGKISTGMTDFYAKRKYMQWYSLYVLTEVYSAMCFVVQECYKVAGMNLYTSNFGKFVPLNEFETAQVQNNLVVIKFLKGLWLENITHNITMCLRDVGKGWYNILEKKYEIYEISKLCRMMMAILQRME
ncbi:hypothetical protein L9F63_014205, partial [Diploptera punctata]